MRFHWTMALPVWQSVTMAGLAYRLKARRGAPAGPAFVALLGALSTLGPLGTDINLPALPAMASSLHAPGALVQLTLSSFLLTFGTGQLIVGPLSDRYGRRPVLLTSLALFTLAGVACALAGDARTLVALRFIQGAGACVGIVSARAIVRDVQSDRTAAASLQAYVHALQSFSIMAAPLIGAGVLALLGWRWIYGFLAVAGTLLFLTVLIRLPETSPRAARGTLAGYGRVLRLPRTFALTAFVTCAWGSYFPLLTNLPFVVAPRFHVASSLVGIACAFMLGAFTAARVVRRVGAEPLMRAGAILVVISGIANGAVNFFRPSPEGFLATMGLFAFTYGLAVPNAFAAVLADAGIDAGLASGIVGAVQMIGGAIGVATVAYLPWGATRSAGVIVLVGTVLAGLSYWRSRRTAMKTASTTLPNFDPFVPASPERSEGTTEASE